MLKFRSCIVKMHQKTISGYQFFSLLTLRIQCRKVAFFRVSSTSQLLKAQSSMFLFDNTSMYYSTTHEIHPTGIFTKEAKLTLLALKTRIGLWERVLSTFHLNNFSTSELNLGHKETQERLKVCKRELYSWKYHPRKMYLWVLAYTAWLF